jgi:diguanylate cyclase (GGDEF)-like protein
MPQKLLWVRSVTRVEFPQASLDAGKLPEPDSEQRRALESGRGALLLGGAQESGLRRVYLVRALPSGALLYVEFNLPWLWESAGEFAGEAGLLLFDGQRRELAFAGPVRPEWRSSSFHFTKRGIPGLSDRWTSRSWEVFLGSRFTSPSWHLVAIRARPTLLASSNSTYLYLCGLILLTILLIAWLSMNSIRRQLRPLGLLTQAAKRVAHRDFAAFRGMTWNDEFGDLARSFDAMSGKLKAQFSALETLADVDRLLLHSPELEIILDTLLPRIANVLGCDSVSVLLFDPDSEEHARAYDHYIMEKEQRPVRRIATNMAAVRAACERSPSQLFDAETASEQYYLGPVPPLEIKAIRVRVLKHDGRCAGALCTGYATDIVSEQDSGIGIADFADRLSLILANLEKSASLHRHANFDSLTGLQNRHMFSKRVAVAAAEERQEQGALLYLDLDHFKRVNDTAGHTAGDHLLRIVGERLTDCMSGNQCVARLGGDEFAVLLPFITAPDSLRVLAERISVSLQRPIVVADREHRVSASIGMAVFPADGTRLEELLKAGDIAMYQAKDAGRGRTVFFHPQMQQRLLERMTMESGMHRALERNEFRIHYQPIVSVLAGGTLGVEALVRWPGENQAPWVPPGVFIPVAEENGIIVKLGEWVLRRACAQFAEWRSAGLGLDYVSVNVSVRQLREPNYLSTLVGALADNGMQGKELYLEITEGVLAHGAELQKTLLNIAALGVCIALDDFGTGYSSLSYLRAYPIHTVKIDRSFIQGLPHDLTACRLAESIILMCAALGKGVVAEGVETESQQAFLRGAGCTTMQGYLLGRPMEAMDIAGFARRLRSIVQSTPSASIAAIGPYAAKRA